MVSRQFLLGLSIVISACVHGALFVVAPRVTVSSIRTVPEKNPMLYRVELREDLSLPAKSETQPRQKGPAPGASAGLSTGPGKIEDLLKRETESLTPGESLLAKAVEVPRLSDRVATEVIAREHELSPEPVAIAKVDAKIIEISQETAREGIEIPRRLATPSPDRIVAENEFPVLRAPSDQQDGSLPLGPLPIVSLLEEPAHAPTGGGGGLGGGGGGLPAYEENVALPEMELAKAPVLPEVQDLARAPVMEEVRKENPYEFLDDLLDIKLDAYVPPGEKEGFFRLQIVPKQGESVSVLPKDVTFVIDASHSILQRKLDGTARAARDMVAALKPQDRFNIVIFRDTATSFQPSLVPATPENKASATAFLTNLESKGETNVYNALRPVIEASPRQGVPGIVLIATDGRPTAGVRDARTIINDVTAQNIQGNSVFAYGAGNTVSRYLLDLLAYRNKGDSSVDPNIETIRKTLSAFFAQVNDPILVDLRADYGRVDKANVFPKEVPDFYKGRAVTVYGRFSPAKDAEFAMRLTGAAESRRKEVIFKADLRKASSGNDQIARNWAFQKIYYLIGEICRVGEKPELLNEVQQLSKKYNIRTSYSE